jgi:hypothetical protein
VRNDYPDHPAGPLDYHEDPAEVIEVRQPALNSWIAIVCGVILVLMGPMSFGMLNEIKEERRAEGKKVSNSEPAFLLFTVPLGLLFIGGGYWVLKHAKDTLIVRPDGLEFPAEGLPPLRWDQIQQVDIATLVLIGAGGAQDYLGIKLRPGVLPDGPSPYSTLVMRAARAAAGWDFDVCISQNNVNINPAHLSMIMRIRLENAQRQGANPPPPPGMQPLGGPAAVAATGAAPGEAPKLAKPRTVPRSGMRMGCATLMVGFGGCTALPGVLVATGTKLDPPKPRPGRPPLDMAEIEGSMMNAMVVGLLLVVIGVVFVWPWPDDEDE